MLALTMQTRLSEKLAEGPSAVKEWGDEHQMEKLRLRVLELEQSLKEVSGRTHVPPSVLVGRRARCEGRALLQGRHASFEVECRNACIVSVCVHLLPVRGLGLASAGPPAPQEPPIQYHLP